LPDLQLTCALLHRAALYPGSLRVCETRLSLNNTSHRMHNDQQEEN
jgi:hypothetical protein